MPGTATDIAAKITVDAEAVNRLLDDLRMTNPEALRATKAALRESLSILRKSVRRGAATVTSNPAKRKLIRSSVGKKGKTAQINIYFGDYVIDARGSKRYFSLRWLDQGTAERGTRGGRLYGARRGGTKNGRYHAATPAKPFFSASIKAAEGEARAALSDNILKHIQRVAERRKK